jgi:GDP-mannose 6-dehydrogenase
MTNISVFGLGYVGVVLCACLADNGHSVTGLDVNPVKIRMINEGHSPIVEDEIDELVDKVVHGGQLRTTTDLVQAVHGTDLSFICVGTPSNQNGSINLSFIKRVCEEIGEALASKPGYHVIVVRSTMLPGSTEELVIPTLEAASGKKAGKDFGVCFNPEFLREGSSIRDFYDPPFTIISGTDDRAMQALGDVYSMLTVPRFDVSIKVAEMIKYATNAFHALKVTFANEIGDICKEQGIDSHQVMEIFCQDTKLNLSPYYLKPGFAFGGSCLPKDLRALLYHSRRLDVRVPVLETILPSNNRQLERAFQMIERTGCRHIGVLGFSFKAGTDDLRESPMVGLIEHLIGKGYHLKVYDRFVSLANLQGGNRAYIEEEIPHIASLMSGSLEEVVDSSDVIVLGHKSPAFRDALLRLREDQVVIDLVRISDELPSNSGQYQGICW